MRPAKARATAACSSTQGRKHECRTSILSLQWQPAMRHRAPPAVLHLHGPAGASMWPHMASHAKPCMSGASQSNLRAACPAANPANPRPLPCRCVGLGASGRLYVGVNLEFPCLPLHNSVHAEQFLVVNALQHGERELVKLAVSAAPCGHCRQFLSELCCAVREAAALSCVVPAPQQPVHSCVVHAPKAACAELACTRVPSQPSACAACRLCDAHVTPPLLIAVGTG